MTKRIPEWIFLPGLSRYQDFALLAARVTTGAFLVHGVWDNIVDHERMREFEQFLAANGLPAPQLMAPLSVWLQFLIGLALIAGFLTRWAGIFCVVNFVVACLMVHWSQDFRGWWPALALVLLGLVFATRGAGRFSVDGRLGHP